MAELFKKIGFIGLGKMGFPMAKNIQASGNQLIVFDVDPHVCEQLASFDNIAVAKNIQEVAEKSDLILMILPDGASVKSVCQGDQGIFNHARKGTFILDCSTVHPGLIQDLSTEAAEYGLTMFDAPVSGGVAGATAGTLTFMVGADSKKLEYVSTILSCMGKKIVPCGSPGHAQVAKICNNLILGIVMIATSEAMSLGSRYGVNPELLTEIIKSSTGNNWCISTNNPWPGVIKDAPSSNGFKEGGSVYTLAKDTNLALQSAHEKEMPLFMGALAAQLYELAISKGYKDLDFSSVIKIYSDI